MKTTLLNILAIGLLVVTSVMAADEGIDYKTIAIPQPTANPDKIEVVEIFWYGCPHCFHVETATQQWLPTIPEYVTFRRIPAPLNPNWKIGAQIFYTAKFLGILEKIHLPFFKAVQESYLPIRDKERVANWFAKHGVPKARFNLVLNSFSVDKEVRQAATITQNLKIDGVPVFLINGKYITSPSMTGSIKATFKVINSLIAKEAKALHAKNN
ncbi:hypothetical protein TI05_12335 [Achromatium sp. WMS3]|nr:hypothetical protein TI05_12335 [Achromatium sp. WMS3]